jgi:hypothetical protein
MKPRFYFVYLFMFDEILFDKTVQIEIILDRYGPKLNSYDRL